MRADGRGNAGIPLPISHDVVGAMAEYEKNLIRERTMAGLAAARAQGRKGGRPKQLDKEQVKVAIFP